MTRRVILGNLGGGVFGLRVSLPGEDVVAGGELSFDSGWTDIVKMIQVGVATKLADNTFTEVLFPSPGYQPFAEVRYRSGLRVYDDYSPIVVSDASPHGLGATIATDRLRLWPAATGSGTAYDVVYAVFRVPVPAP